MHKLLVIGGDGIGQEVTRQARRVLDWFARERQLPVEVDEKPYGVEEYRRNGAVLPVETRSAIEKADVILFGAFGVGGAEDQKVSVQQQEGLLYLRRWREFYINLRPIVTFRALLGASSLKDQVAKGVDLMIVRELNGGIYFAGPRGIEVLQDGTRRGFNTQQYTTPEIHRIAHYAFELARRRHGRVCSVDKANVLESSVLWREEVQTLRDTRYADVQLEHMYVDNCAMQLVRRPAQFDVILTDNIFGDILSDCAAMAAGSLGMLPSASIGPARRDGLGRQALYEPVHGSAPDIAGRDVANPLGAILSLALALDLSLGRPDDAELLERAVASALDAGARTADLCGAGERPLSCSEMGSAVLQQLDNFKRERSWRAMA